MKPGMATPEGPSLRTRPSLVAGLQAGDEDRWTEFFRIYGPVFRGFALKAGLTETEADEVVQETCIGVARNVAEYRYEPARCRFKTWLLNLASWRVQNQFEKRRRWESQQQRLLNDAEPGLAGVSAAAPVPQTGASDLNALWEAEWRTHVYQSALTKVREKISATQFQIFDLHVLKEWPGGEVATALGLSAASISLAKHRVASALKVEVLQIEQRLERHATDASASGR